jgi:hypothetical protein
MSTSSCSVSAIESTTVEARESSLWSEGRVTGALGAKESVVCLAVFFAALEAPFLAEYNVHSHELCTTPSIWGLMTYRRSS